MPRRSFQLVLMPGIEGTGIFFRPFVRVLPPEVSAYVITYPADEALSLEGYASFVRGQLPEDEVVLVAESFSGLVALMLLHDRPENVRGAVFSATFAGPLHRLLIRFASMVPGASSMLKGIPAPLLGHFLFGPYADAALERLLQDVLPLLSARVLKHRAGLIAAGYPFPDERFDIPCLYLQATNDRVVPKKAARWFDGHFTSFELARFEAPHCLLQTKPEECAQRILEYIKKVYF